MALISNANGKVSIGFKETGSGYGVDPQGRNVTSDETVATMRQLILSRGVEVSYDFKFIPAVIGRIPLSPALVAELRRHPNVDYLEPDVGGTWAR